MKKIMVAVIAIALMLSVAGCIFTNDVPTLEDVKDYSAEDFEIYMRGVSREQVIAVWGEPNGSLQEENADMWDIDDESLVVIYWNDNGKLKTGGVNIKEE